MALGTVSSSDMNRSSHIILLGWPLKTTPNWFSSGNDAEISTFSGVRTARVRGARSEQASSPNDFIFSWSWVKSMRRLMIWVDDLCWIRAGVTLRGLLQNFGSRSKTHHISSSDYSTVLYWNPTAIIISTCRAESALWRLCVGYTVCFYRGMCACCKHTAVVGWRAGLAPGPRVPGLLLQDTALPRPKSPLK